MPNHMLEIEPGIYLHVVVDDFTDPWRPVDTVLMVHGMGQNTEAWRGWVPYLARNFRVARFDMRGFGRSTPMPANSQWSMERLLQDIARVISDLGCRDVHLIGAQSGGSMALMMAARRSELVRSVIAVTPPVVAAAGAPQWLEQIEAEGVEAWARSTMAGRLGSQVSDEEFNYWVKNIQGKNSLSTLQGYLRWVPGLDIREEVERVKCPTLIITTMGNGLRSVESVRAWQERLANSELMVIEGDAWHAAGAYPDMCGAAAAKFLMHRRAS